MFLAMHFLVLVRQNSFIFKEIQIVWSWNNTKLNLGKNPVFLVRCERSILLPSISTIWFRPQHQAMAKTYVKGFFLLLDWFKWWLWNWIIPLRFHLSPLFTIGHKDNCERENLSKYVTLLSHYASSQHWTHKVSNKFSNLAKQFLVTPSSSRAILLFSYLFSIKKLGQLSFNFCCSQTQSISLSRYVIS